MKRLLVGFSSKVMWFVIVTSLLILTACHSRIPFIIEPPKLPHRVAGANDATIVAMQEKFNKEGLRVISIGQDYLISIPSAQLFPSESPQLTWGAYSLLNNVACYLRQFRKIAITVTAFSNKCVSTQRAQALTLARARVVGDYLWSQGLNSRFIFTQGVGNGKPIVLSTQGGDQSPNSRVEITFRDAVA